MPADFADRTDFDNANRRLIARLEPDVVKNADGRSPPAEWPGP
jgi:alkyl sulfatase BDS1-like metallo-beta-lactamase superfamily hydrolase